MAWAAKPGRTEYFSPEVTPEIEPIFQRLGASFSDCRSYDIEIIAAGANDGVNVGEVFEIHEVVREVKDPTTKEVLDRITNKVGEMTITSVRDKIATGNYTGSPAKIGFLARKKTQ